jgi:protein regulator of cytokinesis 1
LQQLWGEIGKSREERERMVHELEAECMRVYRRKVDEATGERALLHQSLAASEAEIAALTAALGAENTTQFKVYKGALDHLFSYPFTVLTNTPSVSKYKMF